MVGHPSNRICTVKETLASDNWLDCQRINCCIKPLKRKESRVYKCAITNMMEDDFQENQLKGELSHHIKYTTED